MRIERCRREAASEREAELSRRERKRVPSRARLTCAHGEGGQRAVPIRAAVHVRAYGTSRESRRDVQGPRRAARGGPPARAPPDPPVRPLCEIDLHARGSSKLIVAYQRRLEALACARRGWRGRQGEEVGRTRTHLLSRCSGVRPPCSERVLYLLGPRRKPCTSPRGAVGVERGRSTRLADEDAPTWLWAVGEGGWWCRRSTHALASGAGRQAGPKTSAQS